MKRDFGWELRSGGLWPHQVVTYHERLKHARFNDFSKWGTGKTLPCLASLFRRMAEGRVCFKGTYGFSFGLKRNGIIFTTPSALDGWIDSVEMFSSKCVPVVNYFGSTQERMETRVKVLEYNRRGVPVILLCSWGLASNRHSETDRLWIHHNLRPHYIIADEAQYISGRAASRTEFMDQLVMYPSQEDSFPQADLLTATPITNGAHKAWNYFYIVHQDQKLLHNQFYQKGMAGFYDEHFKEFQVKTDRNIVQHVYTLSNNIEKFKHAMACRSVVHELEDVIKDRKEPVYTTATFDLDDEQRLIYDTFYTFLKYECDEAGVPLTYGFDSEGNVVDDNDREATISIRGEGLAKMIRLRQLASDPAILGLPSKGCKFDTLVQVLSDMGCQPKGLKVVIVVEFRYTWDMLMSRLGGMGYKCTGVRGGMGPDKRREAIKQFQTDPSTQVFVGSRDAMAEGVNLQIAARMINYELGYKADKWSQANHRIDRAGQKNQPTILTLLARSTIDVDIYRKLDNRMQRSNEMTHMAVVTTRKKRRQVLDEQTENRLREMAKEEVEKLKEAECQSV